MIEYIGNYIRVISKVCKYRVMNIIEQVKGDRIKTAKLKIAEFERQNGKTKTD
jgi:hypothetical protein